jgi:hypothetical protein
VKNLPERGNSKLQSSEEETHGMLKDVREQKE